MDLCLAAKQRPGTRVSIPWLEQEGLDLEEIWTAAQESERTEGRRIIHMGRRLQQTISKVRGIL